MKATLLIAAALLGTAAVAQTTPDAAAPAAPVAATTDATAPAAAATTDAMAAPTAAPATDASTNVAGNAQAVDTSNYPACSRTVTDKCVQRGALHKAHPHH